MIKEATKKGYSEADIGDSINTAYPGSATRRGRVGHGVANTILAGDPQQVVVVDAEPQIGAIRGRPTGDTSRNEQHLEIRGSKHTNAITTVQKDNVVIETADTYSHQSPEFFRGPLPEKSRAISANAGDASVIIIDGKECRVRKLTPLECWRLFGFRDEEFYKAKKAIDEKFYKGKDKSSSQLYKQAGNTIVIPMLEAVLQQIKGIPTDW